MYIGGLKPVERGLDETILGEGYEGVGFGVQGHEMTWQEGRGERQA